jgi:hypothetical protein
MTEALAIALAGHEARQRGCGIAGFKHRNFYLPPQGSWQGQAVNQVYYLLDDLDQGVLIQSDEGEYDFSDGVTTELIHTHTGLITIRNRNPYPVHIHFLQVLYT